VAVKVGEGGGVRVELGDGEMVLVALKLRVLLGVRVRVAELAAVNVCVGVRLWVKLSVWDGDWESVAEELAVAL
jgi:hypothetical protein